MMEKVAGYIRVSSQEQKLHGYSLNAQKMKLEDYANTHGLEMVKIYADEGVSGRKLIKNRPALQKMIQAAERKEFDRIIFIKLDRFFRSVAEYHECMKRISPVTWTTTEEEYDLTTANGRMLVNMKLTIAELEADQTGERIRITNEYKVKQGSPLSGSVPFGYMIKKTPDGKRIVKDPDTEPILRDLLDHYMIHQSKRATCIYAQARYGIRLYTQSFNRLLKNTMLYGEHRGNPTWCEPYIDKAMFDKIQKIATHPAKNNSHNFFYFSGLLKCPVCGRTFTGSYNTYKIKDGSERTKKYYRCQGHYSIKLCENNKSAPESMVEKLLLQKIKPLLDNAKRIESKKTDLSNIKEIAKIKGEIDRLNYSWQKGRIGVSEYDLQYKNLTDTLNDLSHTRTPKDYSYIDNILNDDWEVVYNGLTDEYKKAFWHQFISEIILTFNNGRYDIQRIKFL